MINLFSNLFILTFLSYNLIADEYWRPPILGLSTLLSQKETFDLNSFYLKRENASIEGPTVYLRSLAPRGYDISLNTKYLNDYTETLEYFSSSLLQSNPNVVKQGEYKKNKDFLYTFYLNYCFALIINNSSNIIMLHGQPIGHPGFKDDLKAAKKLLSKYKGDVYLVSHEVKDLIKKFNSDRDFYVAQKPEQLIASIKAYKEKSDFLIKGEFHPNNGVYITNYDKLIAHFPWGPMSQLKFEKYKQ